MPLERVQGRCCRELADPLVARVFKSLADPNRIAILARLSQCRRRCTVSEIACCLPIGLSVVSRHLAQLRDAGILHATKRGKEVYYTVRYENVVTRLRRIADVIDECCPGEAPPRQSSSASTFVNPPHGAESERHDREHQHRS